MVVEEKDRNPNILVQWFDASTEHEGPGFESELCRRWSPDCGPLCFEVCIFATQSYQCYGYLSSKVEAITMMVFIFVHWR